MMATLLIVLVTFVACFILSIWNFAIVLNLKNAYKSGLQKQEQFAEENMAAFRVAYLAVQVHLKEDPAGLPPLLEAAKEFTKIMKYPSMS